MSLTKRRYNSKGYWGGGVVQVRCNGVKTPNRLSDAAHFPHSPVSPHTHAVSVHCWCVQVCVLQVHPGEKS